MRKRQYLLAGTMLFAGTFLIQDARAADLGGDCCADLEERVAELEATTARKGNRKVSLTISGWVAQQLMGYDNGARSNVYVTGIGSTISSHFKLTGTAQITSDWSAGYHTQIEANTSDPITAGNSKYGDNGPSGLTIIDTNGDETPNALNVVYSNMHIASKKYGKASIGRIASASTNAAVFVDGSGSLFAANWIPLNGQAVNMSNNGVDQFLFSQRGDPRNALVTFAASWCQSSGLPLAGGCNAGPINGIRYDSPTFGGFSFSTSWGEDDFWDVSARYAGQLGDVKVSAAAAYSQSRDESRYQGFNDVVGLSGNNTPGFGPNLNFNHLKTDAQYFETGLYLQHVPTGLFLYGAYGKEQNDNIYRFAAVNAQQPDGSLWWAKAGIRQKWNPLGNSVLYGYYGEWDDFYHPGFIIANGVTGSEQTRWGLGAVQEIDAASMSLWFNYEQTSTEFEGTALIGPFTRIDDIDDLHVWTLGGMIMF